MKKSESLILLLVLILVPTIVTVAFKVRWASRPGFEAITTMNLRPSSEILDHKAGAVFSLADDPNHKWLLRDSESIRYLNAGGSITPTHLFSDSEILGDMWPSLDEPFHSLEITMVIRGIGTGNEYLILTKDKRIGVVYAFRT